MSVAGDHIREFNAMLEESPYFLPKALKAKLADALAAADEHKTEINSIDTVAFAMDTEQARGVLRDLQKSITLEAKTILLLTTKTGKQNIEQVKAGYMGTSHLPAPDLVIINTVYTLAFATEFSDMTAVLGEHAERIEEAGDGR